MSIGKINRHDSLAAISTLGAAVATLAISVIFDDQFAFTDSRPTGLVLIYAGIALVLWAGFHLGPAIRGFVSPVRNCVVTTGPYRFVRHPVYLGITVSMFGVAIAAQSIAGLIATVILFLPVELHRAVQEERALAERFGSQWTDYADRVGFILPGVGKHTG